MRNATPFFILGFFFFYIQTSYGAISKENITELQSRLMASGFYNGQIDGKISPSLLNTVNRFIKSDAELSRNDELSLAIALYRLREKQNVDDALAKDIRNSRIEKLESDIERLKSELTSFKTDQPLAIKNEILAKFSLWVATAAIGLIGIAVSSYSYIKRMVKRTAKKATEEIHASKEQLEEDIKLSVKESSKTMMYRAHGRAIDFIAYLIYEMGIYYKDKQKDEERYKEILKYGLMATDLSLDSGRELPNEMDENKSALYKLDILSNAAFFYADQNVDTVRHQDAVKIYEEAKPLLPIVKKQSLSTRYVDMAESLMAVAYKFKLEPDEIIKKELNALRIGNEAWFEKIKIFYSRLDFEAP